MQKCFFLAKIHFQSVLVQLDISDSWVAPERIEILKKEHNILVYLYITLKNNYSYEDVVKWIFSVLISIELSFDIMISNRFAPVVSWSFIYVNVNFVWIFILFLSKIVYFTSLRQRQSQNSISPKMFCIVLVILPSSDNFLNQLMCSASDIWIKLVQKIAFKFPTLFKHMGESMGNVPRLHRPSQNWLKLIGVCRARRADHFGIKLS